MTTTFSAAALRMPHTASVAAPAPLAHGVSAEPCAPATEIRPANPEHGSQCGGGILPATRRRGGSEGSDRFGGASALGGGSSWHRRDQADFAGGGPLRG